MIGFSLEKPQPTFDSLFETFKRMTNFLSSNFIIIDAVDECGTRVELLKRLWDLAKCTNVQLLVTSRNEEDIEFKLRQWIDTL
jgi:hypothetical protein